MAFEKLKDFLQAKHPGVGADRIAVRSQGCWNCVNASMEKAQDRWWNEARGAMLARAVKLATESVMGEEEPRVRNIRTQIPLLDAAMERGEWIACSKGRKPDGTPVDDFVGSTYLCDRWTGSEGASIAREGAAPDKLPEELMEQLHDPKG